MLFVGLHTEASDIPTRLNIYIGGFDGPSYSLILTNNLLEYMAWGGGPPLDDTPKQLISPTDAQWTDFRHELDQVGIWSWSTNYVDEGVLDGSQWHVDIAYPDLSITSEGSNAYPGSLTMERGSTFNRLLEAIQRLINGKPFG